MWYDRPAATRAPVMRRRLLNLLTLLSLLLCAAAVGLWVRGYRVVDVAVVAAGRADTRATVVDEWKLMSGKGVLALIWQRDTSPPAPPFGEAGPRFSHSTLAPQAFAVARATFWQRLGFNRTDHAALDPAYPAWSRRSRAVRVPYWSLVLASGALPAWRLPRLWRTRRTVARGHCLACGYDLRATSGRCPECGTAATTLT